MTDHSLLADKRLKFTWIKLARSPNTHYHLSHPTSFPFQWIGFYVGQILFIFGLTSATAKLQMLKFCWSVAQLINPFYLIHKWKWTVTCYLGCGSFPEPIWHILLWYTAYPTFHGLQYALWGLLMLSTASVCSLFLACLSYFYKRIGVDLKNFKHPQTPTTSVSANMCPQSQCHAKTDAELC